MFLKNSLQTQIPKRGAHCVLNEKEPFGPDSKYISHLVFINNSWERRDYCPACWENLGEKMKKEGSFWMGKIPPKRDKPIPPDEKALKLFRQYGDSGENPNLHFVLSLYLQRKKQIVYRPEMRRKGKRFYEIPETGEVVAVTSVILSAEEGDEIAANLTRLLEGNE